MEKKTTIILRISNEHKVLIENKAKGAGLSISAFIRKSAIDLVVIKIEPEDKKVLSGISNNLNQLTKKAHVTNRIPAEIVNTLRELIKTIRHAYRKL